jgi:hypothetical protein
MDERNLEKKSDGRTVTNDSSRRTAARDASSLNPGPGGRSETSGEPTRLPRSETGGGRRAEPETNLTYYTTHNDGHLGSPVEDERSEAR